MIVNLFFFSFTLWLGAYLLARNSQKMTVRLTGWGVLFYAVALALEIIWGQQPNGLLLIPALFWIGAALYLVPEEMPWRQAVIRTWLLISIPIFILTLLNTWFSLIAVLALFACLVLIVKFKPQSQARPSYALLVVIGLFFSLGTGLLVLPLNWIPRSWMIPALGLDLVLMGVAITLWDAFDEGESIRSHILRSFVSSFYYAGALAVFVVIAIAIDGQITLGKLIALVGVIAFGILTQTFSDSIQTILDRLTLPHDPALNDQREILRQTADALPRLSTLEPASMDEEHFARLTRRAISNLGDLPKLSTSPLMNLPAVIANNPDNPLDRVHALKALLTQSIQRLKPQGKDDFGTTDEWRYYNSLYFPYVLGLKPYTRRMDKDTLDETSCLALEWFQSSVPERTLHNWQNAAAKLIADELRARL
ncbi:MAG: hypothetical protein C4557_00860 [Anaerolineaceae bacterium]|nr:MAG: hypothetical protein C4557_00860 [Anaerolineaceae bacterium]